MTLPLDPEGWDGEGVDPWLPTRMARMEQIVSGERSVYDDYFARLSRWLVEVRRAVITDVRVDPTGVFRFVPQWLREMTDFTMTTLLELVGTAYRTIYGPGYRYSQKPFVVAYLGEARNRLVNTPNEVYDEIVGQVAQGAMVGESLPKIAARVDLALDANAVPTWQNRAVTVARTETGGALNAGRTAAFQQVADDLDEPFEQMWLATADKRTRPTHRAADLQRVPLGGLFVVGESRLRFPGDPTGPAREVINCVPGDTLVSFPRLRATMGRRYEGDMVKLGFATGDELTITPNHPVLRADGIWVPAGQLAEGDHCVRRAPDGQAAATPDVNGRPAEIAEVHRAAQVAGRTERVVTAPPDLHGDAADGEVEVVAVERGLGGDREAASEQQVEQFGLAVAHIAGLSGRCGDGDAMGPGAAIGQLSANVASADALAHPTGQLAPSLWAELLQAQAVGLRFGAGGEPQFGETAHDEGAAYAEGSRDGQDALAGLVTTAEIVHIDRFVFVGHVFNLDAGDGWYSANSIIVRNCRCTTLLVQPGEMVDLSNRQFEDF